MHEIISQGNYLRSENFNDQLTIYIFDMSYTIFTYFYACCIFIYYRVIYAYAICLLLH